MWCIGSSPYTVADGCHTGLGHHPAESLCCAQVVREWLPSREASIRINIDATRVGNVARFFNHRCGGGTTCPVVIRRRGELLPVVAMVAREDIAAGDELTFSYGEPRRCLDEDDTKQQSCLCGSSLCGGLLPEQCA